MAILKETDAGMLVKDICRKHGISYATYYNWKSKYGGMEASDLKRIKVARFRHNVSMQGQMRQSLLEWCQEDNLGRRRKEEVVILCEMPASTKSELERLRDRSKRGSDRGFPEVALKSLQRQSVRRIKKNARKRIQND